MSSSPDIIVSWAIDREPDYSILDYLGSDNTNPLNNISIKINAFKVDEIVECCLCLEDKLSNDICQLNCKHMFCVKCIKRHLTQKKSCPLCRGNIYQVDVQSAKTKLWCQM